MSPKLYNCPMLREKSESTHRERLSLRNLLQMEPDSISRPNLLDSRPKTMYTQRQLKMVHEERAKMMTDHRLRRNNSQQMTREQRRSSMEGEGRAERGKLKVALGRINVLAEGLVVGEEERVEAIHRLLDSLSKTENFYQKAFAYVSAAFEDIVYVGEPVWTRQQLEFVADRTRNELLVRLFNGVREITYKELSADLFSELHAHLASEEATEAETQRQFRQLESKLEQKSKLVQKLASTVQFHEQHPSKEQYGYIGELQAKAVGLQNEVRKLTSKCKQFQNNEQYLQQFNNMLTERVEEMRIKLYEFEIEQFSGLGEIEKNSELKDFENNVDLLKDLIHKGALRMAAMRNQYDKIQTYNQELLGERSVLAKRAAVGFAELTPRPNYRKICGENGLDFSKLLPEGVKPSTEELVAALFKRFKDFYQKHVGDPKLQISQSSEGRRRGDPAGIILDQLGSISKQLRKVENMSGQVRSGYNKQKEEKDQVNKKSRK